MYKYIIYACNMKHHLSRHIRNLFSQQSNPTILFLKYSNEPEDCHLSQWLLTQGQINMIKSIYLNSEWRAEIITVRTVRTDRNTLLSGFENFQIR